ncbi:MAG: ATP-grasp domain-containing protein [Gammaproteobacteria bacterium]|nr:ATP-grasp domain-containing protein [Gammaproteobacteria bacterium]
MRIEISTPQTPQTILAKPGHKPGFVLLLAPSGSYRIGPYVKAAQSLGIDILVVSNSKHSLVAEVAEGITVDFSDPPQARKTILAAINKLNILCVLATDDSCVALSSQIAEHLNLPHNSPSASELTHRKDLARQALQKGGCNTPEFQIISLKRAPLTQLNIEYPVVVKPLSLSGSRGVIRADSDEELIEACRRIDSILEDAGQNGFVREQLLVESYLDGAEFAVEGFLINGEFQLLTIFDKPEPLIGPFFEETYYLTPSQLDKISKCKLLNEIAKCCKAYGLTHGPVHAEARITPGRVVLLELAARTIGGQCGQLIELSLEQKLEELIIQGMCGQLPDVPVRFEAAGVLMIPVTASGILKRVEGLTAALQVDYIKDIEIHIREGYELLPLPEGSSYLGFIFAQAPDYQQTYQALKSAYQKLTFVTQPIWKLAAG